MNRNLIFNFIKKKFNRKCFYKSHSLTNKNIKIVQFYYNLTILTTRFYTIVTTCLIRL